MSVRLHDIKKVYRAEGREVTALREITLDAADGEMVAILGASTSGKSTLMHILGLLDRPTSGSFQLDGVEVARLSDAQLTGIRNQKIGLVFRSYHLLPRMSVIDEVELPLLYSDLKPRRHALAAEALQAVGLGECMQRTLSELSATQAPRVALARAVVMHPSLLLFPDEADYELDEQMLHEIWREVQELRQQRNITMFLTPHSLEEAAECDRVAILAAGNLTAYDTPAALEAAIGADCVEIRGADSAAVAALADEWQVNYHVADPAVQMTTSHAGALVERLRIALSLDAASFGVRRTNLEDVCHVYARLNETGRPAETSLQRPAPPA